MVCHALGRCRICAKRHKLPIFGSEENQHALIEKIHLQLIVLNTVCIDCISKFEQFVKNSNLTATFESSIVQHKSIDCYQPYKDTITSTECDNSGASPSMQFYVESESKFPAKIPHINDRLTSRENFEATQENIMHLTQNHKINDAPIMRSSPIGTVHEPKAATKIRAKRKVQCQLYCDFCTKEFTHKGDLKRHKRKHTGEKPYECLECHKTFSQLSNLARHRFVHSGERPFSCAECGQSYSRKGRLANHIVRELCKRKRRVPSRLLQKLRE